MTDLIATPFVDRGDNPAFQQLLIAAGCQRRVHAPVARSSLFGAQVAEFLPAIARGAAVKRAVNQERWLSTRAIHNDWDRLGLGLAQTWPFNLCVLTSQWLPAASDSPAKGNASAWRLAGPLSLGRSLPSWRAL